MANRGSSPTATASRAPSCIASGRKCSNPAPVDPSTCTVPYSVSADPSHVKTTCTPGPATLAYQAVPFCGPPNSVTVGPQWAVQTCDLVVDQVATPLDGSCDPLSPFQDGGSPYTTYTCTTPAATNQTAPVASCPAILPAYGSPDYHSRRPAASRPAPTTSPPHRPPAVPVMSKPNPDHVRHHDLCQADRYRSGSVALLHRAWTGKRVALHEDERAPPDSAVQPRPSSSADCHRLTLSAGPTFTVIT